MTRHKNGVHYRMKLMWNRRKYKEKTVKLTHKSYDEEEEESQNENKKKSEETIMKNQDDQTMNHIIGSKSSSPNCNSEENTRPISEAPALLVKAIKINHLDNDEGKPLEFPYQKTGRKIDMDCCVKNASENNLSVQWKYSVPGTTQVNSGLFPRKKFFGKSASSTGL